MLRRIRIKGSGRVKKQHKTSEMSDLLGLTLSIIEIVGLNMLFFYVLIKIIEFFIQ